MARADDADDAQWYPARETLRLRGKGKRRRYMVDWEPDVETGEHAPPSWQPKENVSDDLLEQWTAKRRQTARVGSRIPATTSTTSASGAETGVGQDNRPTIPSPKIPAQEPLALQANTTVEPAEHARALYRRSGNLP